MTTSGSFGQISLKSWWSSLRHMPNHMPKALGARAGSGARAPRRLKISPTRKESRVCVGGVGGGEVGVNQSEH